MASTIRPPRAVNLVSRDPVRTTTGIDNSPSRPHSGSWVPVPASRRLEARPAAELCLRTSSPLAATGTSPNSGLETQRSTTSARRVETFGQCLVGPLPLGPLAGVVDTGRTRHEDQSAHQVGTGQGQVQAEPRAHRVAEVVGPTAHLS